jgi:L-asparagine oxygenase
MLLTEYRLDGLRRRRTVPRTKRALLAEAFSRSSTFAVHLSGSRFDDAQLLDLVSVLGDPTATKRNPELIRRIAPVSTRDAPPNTLSSRYGTGSFPFHTDGAHWREPPRFLILYCDDDGEAVRPTLLCPVSLPPGAQLSALERDPWFVDTGRRCFLAPVAKRCDSWFELRYDAACMRPTSAGMQSERVVRKLLCAPTSRIDWKRGDVLAICNTRCLHARGPAETEGRERVLARVLIGGVPWQ